MNTFVPNALTGLLEGLGAKLALIPAGFGQAASDDLRFYLANQLERPLSPLVLGFNQLSDLGMFGQVIEPGLPVAIGLIAVLALVPGLVNDRDLGVGQVLGIQVRLVG